MDATVKGSVVTAGYDYMRRTFGEDVWRGAMARLPLDDQQFAAASSRTLQYPVALDGRVFAAVVAEQFGGDRTAAERALRAGGAAQADAMLRGVFSVFARLASPRQAFLKAGAIITSVYTGVTSSTEEYPDGSGGIIHIHGLGESRFVAPWQCGWMESALLHFGSTSPRVTERSWTAGSDSSDHLAYEVRF